MAVPFDLESLTIRGEPMAVFRNVSGDPATRYSVSQNGVLVYPGRPSARIISTVNRQGIERPLLTSDGAVAHIRTSPSGDQIVYEGEGANGGSDFFVFSRASKISTRITRDGRSRSPEWSADGRRLYWIAEDSIRRPRMNGVRRMRAASQLFSRPVDASEPPQRLATPPGLLHTFTVSPDGEHIASPLAQQHFTSWCWQDGTAIRPS